MIACSLISLLLANTIIEPTYQDFFQLKFAGLSIWHWISDGLMAIFFLFIGLELERCFWFGILAGIGFTMSIFITLLAFDDEVIINNSKLIILLLYLIAGVVGYIFFKANLKISYTKNEE